MNDNNFEPHESPKAPEGTDAQGTFNEEETLSHAETTREAESPTDIDSLDQTPATSPQNTQRSQTTHQQKTVNTIRKSDKSGTEPIQKNHKDRGEQQMKQRKQQTQDKSQKKSKRLLAVLIGILLMVLAALATWYIMTTYFTSEPQETNETPAETAAPTTYSASEVTKMIQDKLSKDVLPQYETAAITVPSQEDMTGPIFTLQGNNFATNSGTFYPVKIAFADTNSTENFDEAIEKANTAAVNTLTAKDFTKIKDESNKEGVTNYHNKDSRVVCTLLSQSYSFEAACADEAAFESVAKELAPFAKAQKNATVLYGPAHIKDSQTKGYQTAELSAPGAMSLFYRQQGGEWNYFTSTQQALPCSDFSTTEIQSAFLGEPCIDSSDKQSTVVVTGDK